MSIEYAHKLGLPPMVSENTDNHETAFTVSIDHVDTTTGISAVERASQPANAPKNRLVPKISAVPATTSLSSQKEAAF
mgnify:CR=1 FL=1